MSSARGGDSAGTSAGSCIARGRRAMVSGEREPNGEETEMSENARASPDVESWEAGF